VDSPEKVVGEAEAASQTAKPEAPASVQTGASVRSADELHEFVAVAAYYFAQARNFEPGHEMDDWLKAEAQFFAKPEDLKKTPQSEPAARA
jgi:DUF2934 family protein